MSSKPFRSFIVAASLALIGGRALGQDNFPDVPANHWAYEAVRSKQGQTFLGYGPNDKWVPTGKMPKLDYLPILLLNPKVQKDMGVSPAVAQQEMSLIMQMGLQMLPMAQGGAQTPQSRQKMIRAYEDLESKAIAPLSQPQRVRLHQLTLQFYGPMALAMPDVSSKVGLTEAQKTKVQSIVSAGSQGMQGHMPKGKGDMMGSVGAMSKAMKEARAREEEQIGKILTPPQRAKWLAMQGRKLPGVTEFGGFGF